MNFPRLALTLSLSSLMIPATAQQKPESLEDRLSYSYGLMIARKLDDRGLEIDINEYSSAMKTALEGGEPILSEDEVKVAFDNFSEIAYSNGKYAGLLGGEFREEMDEIYMKRFKLKKAGKFQPLMKSVSYAYGLTIARQLTERGIEINLDQFTAASKTVVDGGEPLLSEEEAAAAFDEFYKPAAMANMSPEDKANMEEGEKFLEENARKDGVKVTDSGLQYEVLEEGGGANPEATDVVKVHYHGTLIDGTVFDSSVDRGEPTSFPLNRVIPGWTEGVQLMKEGAKYRFYIPQDLAYGEHVVGTDIKPFSTLIFEVELLGIEEE